MYNIYIYIYIHTHTHIYNVCVCLDVLIFAMVEILFPGLNITDYF